jgi:cyanophycinase-like exopeptidase
VPTCDGAIDRNRSAAHPQRQVEAARGSLALIGGRFEADNDALYAPCANAAIRAIAVLSMASGYPREVGEETVHEFRAQGFYAELVPIFFENARPERLRRGRLIERLQAFGSVFFTGGDQSRIVGTLIQDGARDPGPARDPRPLRRRRPDRRQLRGRRDHVRTHAPRRHSLRAISRGVEDSPGAAEDFDAFRLGSGLGFFHWGMVDQHFLARGRIGRLVCGARPAARTWPSVSTRTPR